MVQIVKRIMFKGERLYFSQFFWDGKGATVRLFLYLLLDMMKQLWIYICQTITVCNIHSKLW